MKTIFTFLKNWFEKNGLIKIIITFVLLIIAIIVVRKAINPTVVDIFNWIGIIAACYLVLTFLLFFINGIRNSIKDIRNNK